MSVCLSVSKNIRILIHCPKKMYDVYSYTYFSSEYGIGLRKADQSDSWLCTGIKVDLVDPYPELLIHFKVKDYKHSII